MEWDKKIPLGRQDLQDYWHWLNALHCSSKFNERSWSFGNRMHDDFFLCWTATCKYRGPQRPVGGLSVQTQLRQQPGCRWRSCRSSLQVSGGKNGRLQAAAKNCGIVWKKYNHCGKRRLSPYRMQVGNHGVCRWRGVLLPGRESNPRALSLPARVFRSRR